MVFAIGAVKRFVSLLSFKNLKSVVPLASWYAKAAMMKTIRNCIWVKFRLMTRNRSVTLDRSWGLIGNGVFMDGIRLVPVKI